EGLSGKDAAKSIALNTGMDLALGGAIEVASPAIKKFAKDLSKRLGRTVTEQEAKEILEKNVENKTPEKLPTPQEMLERKTKAPSRKERQLEVIKRNNPMGDDLHTGIRSASDIKSSKEVFDIDAEEYLYPDFTKQDGEKALSSGKITVYSSKPIKEGGFVSPSKLCAQDYAGSGKIYSKEVDVNDIAWIDNGEGQYAPVEKTAPKLTLTENLEKNIDSLSTMKDVSAIKKARFQIGEGGLIDKVLSFYTSMGGKVTRADFGDVEFTRRGIKASMAHGMTPGKVKAFESAPDVVKNGKQINIEPNWKGRGYDTYVFAAPVNIEGRRYIEGVIVKKDFRANRFYVHDVIEDLKNNSERLFKPGPSKEAAPSNLSPVTDSIGERIENVNTQSQKIPPVEEMVKRQMAGKGAKGAAKAQPPEPLPTPQEMVKRKMRGKDEKPLKEMGWLEKRYTDAVDNLHGIARADEGAKILSSNMSKAQGTSGYIAKNGMVDMHGKNIAKKRPDGTAVSLERIFNEAADIDMDAFSDYLLHRHNIDRARQGKNIFFDVDSSQSKARVNELLMQYPQFKQLGDEISEINTQLIDEWLVKSGLVSKELASKLKAMYPNYVPTFREVPETLKELRYAGYSDKTVKANSMIHAATGGDKPVIAPNISIAMQLKKAIRASRMNELALQLRNAIKENPEKFKNIARFADETAATKQGDVIAKNMMDSLESKGIEGIDDAMEQLIGVDKTTGEYFLVAMDKGKPVRMMINKDIYDALQALNKVKDNNKAVEIYNFMSNAMTQPFKALITGYNPFFGIRNILRDIPTAYIQGTEHNPVKFVGNQVHAYKDIFTNDPLWQQFQAMGGKRSGYFNSQKGLATEKGLAGEAKNFVRKLLDAVAFFNETTESATRYAEFRGTLKRAGKLSDPAYEDLQRALYNSGEVTVNFDRHGDVTKAIDKIVPYLNPAVQGIDKFMRTMTTSPTAWAKGFAALTIPSIGLY
ncbi:MAG: hypothetical protein J5622_04340, partial [Firmicutes bacterium]|nr:hypothetical protein [Bacillota bacterium]